MEKKYDPNFNYVTSKENFILTDINIVEPDNWYKHFLYNVGNFSELDLMGLDKILHGLEQEKFWLMNEEVHTTQREYNHYVKCQGTLIHKLEFLEKREHQQESYNKDAKQLLTDICNQYARLTHLVRLSLFKPSKTKKLSLLEAIVGTVTQYLIEKDGKNSLYTFNKYLHHELVGIAFYRSFIDSKKS